MKKWILFSITCYFLSFVDSNCLEIPKGYKAIEACDEQAALFFWEMLQTRGALIGEDISLLRGKDGTTTIHNWNSFFDLVLFETGKMECYRHNEIVQGEGTYTLYKTILQNDGSLCYMLICNGSGSGNYDWICSAWKIVEDRIERLNISETLANSFFPGNDAHLFYSYHATPFLLEKDGKIFMRWMDGYFPKCPQENDNLEPLGIYTYCWEGNTFRYVPSLSEGNDPIVGPKKKLQEYRVQFHELQKKAVSVDCEVVEPVNFENLKEFIHLQSKTDFTERYPAIHLSKEGYFAVKMDQSECTPWKGVRLQSDVSLESDDYDKYLLYRGDFLNDGRDIFILVKTYNTLMFHDFEDQVWVWEVLDGKLRKIALEYPTNWISYPFITKKENGYRLHFIEKCKTLNKFEENLDFHFEPSVHICQFEGTNNIKDRTEIR